MLREVDARGLLCPEPVLLTKRELEQMTEGTVRVLVSNAAAKENVSRLAEKLGWSVNVTTEGEDYVLVLSK